MLMQLPPEIRDQIFCSGLGARDLTALEACSSTLQREITRRGIGSPWHRAFQDAFVPPRPRAEDNPYQSPRLRRMWEDARVAAKEPYCWPNQDHKADYKFEVQFGGLLRSMRDSYYDSFIGPLHEWAERPQAPEPWHARLMIWVRRICCM